MSKSMSVQNAPTSLLLSSREGTVFRSFRCVWLAAAATFASFLFSPTMCLCQTPAPSILCNGGNGAFDGEFSNGIKVHVGAARNRKSATLAIRTCTADLRWGKQEFTVATAASQLDLDAFGVDFGDGVPVAAFQVKKTDADCCMDYMIYSLEKPPRLLWTITEGQFFNASDRDLDGRVEIWTRDAAVLNGFENLELAELDYPPTVVFHFAHGRLVDVSDQFQSYFDEEIARIASGIHAEDLRDFKSSDGRLKGALPVSPNQLYKLRIIKIKVLEIVWAYLYSGREQNAWRSLAEMWPSEDVDRIRAAIMTARTHGIHSQADVASADPAAGKRKHARIFDAVGRSEPAGKLEVVPPQGILMQRPATPDIQREGANAEKLLDLVVDDAGKVRSAEPAGKVKWVDPELINAALTWKFIPAFKDSRPVASRVRLDVSLRR